MSNISLDNWLTNAPLGPSRGGEKPHNSRICEVPDHAQDVVILCNAQPFGFGPAATLCAVLPHLRKVIVGQKLQLHYVGSGHTLALHPPRKDTQDMRGWDAVHDLDIYREGGPQALLKLLATLRPALFLTVSDETAATMALDARIPVVIIDQLLWFWHKIPATWSRAYRVIATDFYNVKERIEEEGLTNVMTVPAIAPQLADLDGPTLRTGLLVNMGGLRNPYIPADDHVCYAQVIDTAVRTALGQFQDADKRDMPVQILTSPEIVANLGPARAKTAWPEEAQRLMRTSQLVCMTPGLGNLFEAAACAHEVFILPPINESQGRQMVMLQREGLLHHCADWHDLVGGTPINYWRPELEALRSIQAAQRKLMESPAAQRRLVEHIAAAIRNSTQSSSKTHDLPLRSIITKYGNDGARVMANAIVATFNEIRSNDVHTQKTAGILPLGE